ncbi:hypothetical protein BCT86_13995 [Vibrio breoganii]|uniref:DUF1656 domain-containing protein n=1 Tax=Vibrio breoganii TaxID=553239 RepID=A0AAN1CTY8_9VIBR|nr:DUF1656 domain-containing protein [Vibrio breoganii]ANO35181.1 hypothetical protein A6E01_18590 [Vibrio breoganii]OED92502.1 hypothetical protein A1QE_05980 [Vibrio breoganii ZF-55]OED96512.1 hypothetical protein A1QG_14695 [Vibrio breoganii ZF-29]PMG77860.1 hypothetical protein BCU83_14880 [Vibrio breoganii]PMG95123.1 hypothetical protein BCU80_05295 [Vibrio breoganii]
MPSEVVIGEIYFPPLLLAVLVSYLATTIFSFVGNKVGIYRYIAVPAIFELSLVVIFVGVISRYWNLV